MQSNGVGCGWKILSIFLTSLSIFTLSLLHPLFPCSTTIQGHFFCLPFIMWNSIQKQQTIFSVKKFESSKRCGEGGGGQRNLIHIKIIKLGGCWYWHWNIFPSVNYRCYLFFFLYFSLYNVDMNVCNFSARFFFR